MILAQRADTQGDPLALERDEDRRASYLVHVGLNREQGKIAMGIAQRYDEYIADLRAQAIQVAGLPVPGARFTNKQRQSLREISKGRRAFMAGLIGELHAELDDQGDRIVRAYIRDQVKPNVKFKDKKESK